MTNLESILKSRHHFAYKDLYSQSYGFSNSHVQMLELDHKEGWVSKNWFFQTVVLEKTPESPLDCKEIKQEVLKEINPEYYWMTGAEAEAPILWPPDMQSQLIGKDPEAGKDWRKNEMGAIEKEVVRYHHQLNGREFEQTLGDS